MDAAAMGRRRIVRLAKRVRTAKAKALRGAGHQSQCDVEHQEVGCQIGARQNAWAQVYHHTSGCCGKERRLGSSDSNCDVGRSVAPWQPQNHITFSTRHLVRCLFVDVARQSP